MDENYLPYFIDEQIFIVDERSGNSALESKEDIQESPKPEIIAEVVIIPLLVLTGPLTSEDRALFSKILGALGKNINEVTIIENPNQLLPSYEKLIIFGDHLVDGTNQSYYSIIDNSTSWLRSNALSEIANSKEEKTKLWKALQLWFNIG